MAFELDSYTPVDYRNWVLGDAAREGVNLKRLNLLEPKELEIFDQAIPFQDQRDDPGQGELVTYFAVELLKYLPGAREVAVPAATLHDTGWYGGDPDAWKKLVASGGNTEGEAKRRPHQNRGVLIAGRILEQVGYPEEHHHEIADIIGDHDTRLLPTTDSGRIMRAADLLWRVTHPCMEQYFPDAPCDDALGRMERTGLYLPPPHELGDIEAQIGKIELVNTLFFRFKDEAADLLSPEYAPELKRAREFYNE